MEETKVTFETAKLAKNKRFDIETHTVDYMLNGNYVGERGACISCTEYALAPTQSLLQKWLREVHKLDVSLHLNQFGYGYMYAINDVTKCKNIVELKGGPDYKWTYEEALEVGLQEALKLIK